jgi:pilus assembly protein CpaF
MVGAPLNILKTNDVDALTTAFERLQQKVAQSQLDTTPSTSQWRDQPSFEQFIEQLLIHEEIWLKNRLRGEYLGLGPLEGLIHDETVTEILINGPHSIWYESQGQWHGHQEAFLSDLTFRNFYHRLCAEAHLQTTLDKPMADGRWREFRICIVQSPVVRNLFNMSLRRHRPKAWTLSTLETAKWAPAEVLQLVREIIADRKNVLIVGPTGSGKTSVLNALLAEIPSSERVVILEDTDELQCANNLATKLLTRWDCQNLLTEITLSDLVRLALRLRPDRLVMGEVRGAEAKDLLMALSTGHRGSLATLHAESARQALLRLEMLIQLGAPQWSIAAVRQLLQLTVDVVMVVTMENGHRQLESVWRLASLESFGFTLESLYERTRLKLGR